MDAARRLTRCSAGRSMTKAYDQLERLLGDPDFWENDTFMTIHGLAAHLSDPEWRSLESRATSGPSEWWERFLTAVDGVDTPAALSLALRLLSDASPDIALRGLGLLAQLPRLGGAVGHAELEQLAQVWTKHPEWRSTIAQATWRMGQSRRLRERLGVPSYRELSAGG